MATSTKEKQVKKPSEAEAKTETKENSKIRRIALELPIEYSEDLKILRSLHNKTQNELIVALIGKSIEQNRKAIDQFVKFRKEATLV